MKYSPVDTPVRAWHPGALRAFLAELIIVARLGLLLQQRRWGWLVSLSISPFLMLAPFVLLGRTMASTNAGYLEAFARASGYDNFLGYMIFPLITLGLTNTVLSAVGAVMLIEQATGTLECLLASLRYPATLPLGRAISHALFLWIFTAISLALSWGFFRFSLHADIVSGTIILLLHAVILYGVAFLCTSFFLWVSDAFILQQYGSRFLLYTLTGASFPIQILPGWLQALAWCLPFTWLFDLERRAFLRAEPLSAMVGPVLVLIAMGTVIWGGAFYAFERLLRHAKTTGHLGTR